MLDFQAGFIIAAEGERSISMKRFLTVVLLMASAGVSIAPAQGVNRAGLMKPDSLTERAPDKFRVRFDTSAGAFVIDVTREWAPIGADRFYNLVKNGYYNDNRFFRVVPGFMVQFGINGDPAIQRNWVNARIKDEPVKQDNTRGYVTFAKCGAPDCRSTQLFINFGNNAFLNGQGFAPFGRVTSGMDVVDKIHSGYGERPDQGRIQSDGNAYLQKEVPRLDFIKSATIENK
jgi:peptidyl-prolyl cis-trans isomerase A (cyclophilin A)